MSDPVFTPRFGWKADEAPAAVAEVSARIRARGHKVRFQDAAPNLMDWAESAPGQPVVLHNAAKKVTGAFLPSQYQNRGTCVSRGAKRTVDLTQCVLIAAGAQARFHLVSHAYIYGTCRTHGGALGGDPANENDDGAVGAWAAWSVSNDGNILNTDDKDSDNDDALAVQWGAKGVPDQYKSKGKLHLIKSVALARTFEEVRAAITSGHAVTVASDVGFEGGPGGFVRDANGMCRTGGQWPHQMMYSAYHPNLGGGEALLIDQSWGPTQPGGPIGPVPIPTYSFWASKAACERMISQGDTWVYNGLDAWTVKLLDYTT